MNPEALSISRVLPRALLVGGIVPVKVDLACLSVSTGSESRGPEHLACPSASALGRGIGPIKVDLAEIWAVCYGWSIVVVACDSAAGS